MITSTSGLHRNFRYNALGQLAGEYSTEASTPGTSYVHTDMLGSTRLVTDQNGATVECYDYMPFGRLLSDGVNDRGIGCHPPTADTFGAGKLPQKFTGKERDAETRLDYFGARYFSAAQGRFTSADPLMASAKTSVPQTWNRYSYGLNNPLRFIDPTGMYICDGTEDECDDFEDTLKRIRKSKDKNALRAANAYGERGKNNGVTVGFDNKLADRAGEVVAGPLAFANDRFTATMRVLIQRDNIKNEETIAHEGSHAADRQDFVSTIRADGRMTDSLNITLRESEFRAYQLSVQYALTGNKQLNFGPCGMDECRFTSSQAPVTRDRLINQLLNDARNPYALMNLNQVLYPDLLKPQQK